MELIQHILKVTNGQETIVCPISDIQWTGRPEAIASDHLKAHLAKARDLDAYYVGLGDYIDFASPSNRTRLRNADLYDNAETVIQDKARELTKQLYDEYLRTTAGRWLGLLHGHHYAELDGQTSDQYLASLLGAAYLGTCAYVALDFHCSPDRHGRILLWLHHGVGSGKAAAPITKLETIANYFEADIFIQGHMTKLAGAPINRVYPKFCSDKFCLEHKKMLLVGSGGWSKAYMVGNRRNGRPHGCYVEQGVMPPTSLGGPFIHITPQWDSRRWCPVLSVEV